ncbi:MAG: NAD-dependent epimerase/dehydratase family protein [Lentisphaerae bacterium]|nr:NAD-dependent epimerase/dehydratase family protein [Lentisphaerota bacterium]
MSKELSLVTGASGFVGGHLVRLLVDRGVPVRGMVRDEAKAGVVRESGAEVVVGDLQDIESLRQAVKGVGKVYSIASLFRQAGLPEAVFHDINAEGIRRLFDVSIEAGVERLIHCSTVGVLGHIADPPGTEESPFSPGDMYQRTKLEGEKIALDYYRSGRMRGVVIRPAMIYGPGDTRNLKLFRMIAKRRFFYVGPGRQHVHFIDVRDLANAFTLAMSKEDVNGEVYIIAGEKAVMLREMADLVADRLGVPKPFLHLPVKPMQWLGSACEAVCTPLHINPPIFRRRVDFFTKNRHFDASKAARDLGFHPAHSFEDEVSDIIDWYRAQGWV